MRKDQNSTLKESRMGIVEKGGEVEVVVGGGKGEGGEERLETVS